MHGLGRAWALSICGNPGKLPGMRAFLLLLFVVFAVGEERWFSGTLGGQPLASLLQSERPLPDGGQETTTAMLLVIRRSLPGRPELRLQMSDEQTFTEDRSGLITQFRFDHDENGTVTTAVGRVADGMVTGTLSRLGRTTPISIPIPTGVRLLGDQAGQRALIAAGLVPGSKLIQTSLAMLANQVQLVTSTATCRERGAVGGLFEIVVDAMPLPMQVRLNPQGVLTGMTMNLGMLVLELKPAAGPVALLGADLPPTGLVTAVGPAPRPDGENRLRLPPGQPLPENPFQREADGIVSLSRQSRDVPPPAATEYLGPTPQLELDDPALRTWVAANQVPGQPDAERLRLAVRSHIVHKDLSKGDASALETYRTQTGDCTEHATLLAAALRIAGIPARIEVGLVFAPDYHGWVGHAWNSAWVGGRWIHLDSAYPGISRSCYLALGYGESGQTGAQLMVQLNRFLGQRLEVLP